jgi:ppGpp synthetase/RelA/SpoT-type nucleotidyltranferase
MSIDLSWFNDQVTRYADLKDSRYDRYAESLKDVLEAATRRIVPHALVQVRPKGVASFAEKILRKRDKHADPVNQLTDLCGARVITHTRAEVEAVCAFIRTHFEIDEENSVDSASRLRANEFGYRSVHYIVQLLPGKFPTEAVPVTIPPEVLGLKAEIQVRTIAQHCWADIGHDRVYKSSFVVPDEWVRESARAAALLEDVDQAFGRMVQGLEAYQTSYGVFMTDERMREEIEILEAVRRCGDPDLQLASRIARLAANLQDWKKVVAVAQPHQNSKCAPLLHCLGTALCQINKKDRRGAGYQKGRAQLEKAIEVARGDVEILTALAETWIGIDDDRALELFERAFKVDPAHPQALGGYARMKITQERTLAFVPLIRPSLEAAIRRCHDQAAVRVNLPWAYYSIGEFNLLLGRPYESLAAYARAVQASTVVDTIDTALELVERFHGLKHALPAAEWVRRLLLLARTVKFPRKVLDPRLTELATKNRAPLAEPVVAHGGRRRVRRNTLKNRAPLTEPVVIVAGGCDAAVQQRIDAYRTLLIEAFRNFRGTILSGGTTAGISGLVGELKEKYPGQIRAVGYLPRSIPSWASKDQRYELYYTEGTDFSPLEPLQNWIDLLAAGIDPSRVKLLGINGGEIAAFEYRLALALGARVGLLRDSGREAGRMLWDAEWETMPGLVFLPSDLTTLESFIGPSAQVFPPDVREKLAQDFHQVYLLEQKARHARTDAAMKDWPDLPEHLKESNRQMVDHLLVKLKAVGKAATPVQGRDIVVSSFTREEVEIMAEMEHGRWNAERLLDGWTEGPRDPLKKKTPYLVSWANLPDAIREYDRHFVRRIPEILQRYGLEVGPAAP